MGRGIRACDDLGYPMSNWGCGASSLPKAVGEILL